MTTVNPRVSRSTSTPVGSPQLSLSPSPTARVGGKQQESNQSHDEMQQRSEPLTFSPKLNYGQSHKASQMKANRDRRAKKHIQRTEAEATKAADDAAAAEREQKAKQEAAAKAEAQKKAKAAKRAEARARPMTTVTIEQLRQGLADGDSKITREQRSNATSRDQAGKNHDKNGAQQQNQNRASNKGKASTRKKTPPNRTVGSPRSPDITSPRSNAISPGAVSLKASPSSPSRGSPQSDSNRSDRSIFNRTRKKEGALHSKHAQVSASAKSAGVGGMAARSMPANTTNAREDLVAQAAGVELQVGAVRTKVALSTSTTGAGAGAKLPPQLPLPSQQQQAGKDPQHGAEAAASQSEPEPQPKPTAELTLVPASSKPADVDMVQSQQEPVPAPKSKLGHRDHQEPEQTPDVKVTTTTVDAAKIAKAPAALAATVAISPMLRTGPQNQALEVEAARAMLAAAQAKEAEIEKAKAAVTQTVAAAQVSLKTPEPAAAGRTNSLEEMWAAKLREEKADKPDAKGGAKETELRLQQAEVSSCLQRFYTTFPAAVEECKAGKQGFEGLWLLPGGGLDETEWQSKADKIMSKYIKKGEEAAKRGSSGTAADWVELLYVDYRGKYGVDPRSVGSGGAGLLSPPLPLAAAAPPAATRH